MTVMARQPQRFWTITVFAAALLCAIGPEARAQGYPSKPVRVLVGVPPGGVTDLAARIVFNRLSEMKGQSFVIENRPGAIGSLAGRVVLKSPADGYTLLMGSSADMAIGPSLLRDMPHDTLKDFTGVVPVSSTAMTLSAHPSLPANTIPELIQLAKARPGALSYASAGNGTVNHIVGEWFKSVAGVDITHVPYRGGGPATQDLIAGQVPLATIAVSNATPFVKAGKLKVLAVTSGKRVPFQPDWPTVAEAGFPQFDATVWVAVFAPAGTPADVISWLNGEINGILKSPDIRDRFHSQGAEVTGGTPEALNTLLRQDSARYAQLIKQFGIKLD